MNHIITNLPFGVIICNREKHILDSEIQFM